MNSKFSFYEVVRVNSDDPSLTEINHLEGAITGMVQDEAERWFYSVDVFEQDVNWAVSEIDILPTGKFMKREDFYEDDRISVTVDPNTGKGSLSE